MNIPSSATQSLRDYIERCERLGVKCHASIVYSIARQTGEDTSWFDAQR